jgi:ribonuclease P protein component
VQRHFRLTRSIDFKRVRNYGKSFAHPLVVLIVHGSDESGLRVGITAGRSFGNAVRRNRAKRLLRESARPLIPALSPGHDLMLIARPHLLDANFTEIQAAIRSLLARAGLYPGS